MGAFHNIGLVSNYQILHSNVFALSILWVVHYYNGMLVHVEHKGCWCDFGAFWVFNGETEDLFYIVYWMFQRFVTTREVGWENGVNLRCVEKNLERVKRITKSSGDIKP